MGEFGVCFIYLVKVKLHALVKLASSSPTHQPVKREVVLLSVVQS